MLLDLRMPGPSGLDLQAALPGNGIPLPVVFMTGHADVAASVRAMKAGAVDFLAKPVERKRCSTRWGAPSSATPASARPATGRALRARFATLSPRERDVFERVVAASSTSRSPMTSASSERTVKAQRAQLMDKLGAGSAAELGALAERLRGLTDE